MIDTNVLVSAVLKDKEPETVILYVATQLDFEWIVSPEIVFEYKDVLSRKKFGLTEALQQQWFQVLNELTTVVENTTKVNFPRDQKDAKFLACAISGDANYLKTGDRDFVEAKKMLNTTIISVSHFKKLMIDQ